MGFSWAVYLAQQATTAAAVEVIIITESELLHHRQLDLGLEHGPRGFVHIDNIGLIGKDFGEVDMIVGLICRELRSRGLLTHELCRAARCCDILGIELAGEKTAYSCSVD